VGLAATIALFLLITTIPAHLDVDSERTAIYALILAHVPLMIIEGTFTALVARFLQRVKPDLLESK
jgi:cobalt/nickel transport system permease protein